MNKTQEALKEIKRVQEYLEAKMYSHAWLAAESCKEALEQQDFPDCEKLIDDMNVLAKDLCACEDKLKALEQQEPVAWREVVGNVTKHYEYNENKKGEALYTHPAKNESSSSKQLSDDELSKLFAQVGWIEKYNNLRELGFYDFARAIEVKIRGK